MPTLTLPPSQTSILPPEKLGQLEQNAKKQGARNAPIGWLPNSDKQRAAFESEANIIGYGGQAGGGKTALALGFCMTKHLDSIIFRREASQLSEIIKQSRRFIGERGRFNENLKIWRGLPGKRLLELGGVQQEDDVDKWKGRAHDFIAFDEATEFSLNQILFLSGWLRTIVAGQPCRMLLCFNPPTSAEGEWVLEFFAPWLQEGHENPAQDGEIRWYVRINDKDVAVPDGSPVEHADDHGRAEILYPKSRTFFHAGVRDNTAIQPDYIATLQALPEPLRSQLLYGDFAANKAADVYQLLDTESVRIAQQRWQRHEGTPPSNAVLVSLGVDPARGGKDNFVISPLYEGTRPDVYGPDVLVWWYAPQKVYPGVVVPDGDKGADLVLLEWAPGVAINIEETGVGTSPTDSLRRKLREDYKLDDDLLREAVYAINPGRPSPKDAKGKPFTDVTGLLEFLNERAKNFWYFREVVQGKRKVKSSFAKDGTEMRVVVELPPSLEIRADLTVPHWHRKSGRIGVEDKDAIKKRLPDRRSTDFGDPLVMAPANRHGAFKKKRKVRFLSANSSENNPFAAILAGN